MSTRHRGWRRTAIGDLALGGPAGVAGGPFGSALGRKDYVATGVPVVRGAQLSEGSAFSLDDLVFVSEEKADRHRRNLAYPGDVLVTQRGTLGQVGVIPRSSPYERYLLSQSQMKITPEPTKAASAFVYFALRAPENRARLADQALTAGVPHINLATLREFELHIPSLSTQRRIVDVLSAFDELIEINERRIELLEDLTRSLYREWFVRLRFPGHDSRGHLGSVAGHPPDGWTSIPFSATGDFLNGFAFKPSDWGGRGIPIIKIKELKQGVTAATPRYSGSRGMSRYVVEPGDLLFSWSADLGVYLWSAEPGLLNQHLFKITPAKGIGRLFLFHALAEAVPEFRSRAQGTTMKHIKRSALDEVFCLVPDAAVLSSFEAAVGPLHEDLLVLKNATVTLAATRDLLLPRLVTGRLDISDVDLGDLLPAEAA